MKKRKSYKRKPRGLRKRWLVSTVVPVTALLMVVVTLLSFGISSYYYGSMEKGLETRAQVMANSFNEYFMDNGYNNYYQKATQMAETFEDKNRIELQFIDSRGRIEISTSGLTAGSSPPHL